MKLIVAIVPSTYADALITGLAAGHYQATLISTTGGFLRRGNATLLIGVQSEQVDDVLQRVQTVCGDKSGEPDPEQGSATIFVLRVDEYLQT
jgi:uncharacterized protein YaaQ